MAKRKRRMKGPARDARGRFISTRRLVKRRAKRHIKLRAKGLLGLERLALPRDEISPAFRKFTRPVAPFKRRVVYVFVEVRRLTSNSPLDFLDDDETAVVPVKIGRYTRAQLARVSREEMGQRIRDAIPGADVVRIAGFGHALTLNERKGMRFERATGTSGKARKKGNRRRNKPSRKG